MSAFTATSALSARRSAFVVRAAEEPAAETTEEAPAEPVIPAAPTSFTLQQAFAFTGPEGSNFAGSGPELMNGRLAMVGFVAAAGAEIATGEPVYQQFGEATTQIVLAIALLTACLLYTSPSPRDKRQARMPSSA